VEQIPPIWTVNLSHPKSNDVVGTARRGVARCGAGRGRAVGGRCALLHLDDLDLHVELAQPGRAVPEERTGLACVLKLQRQRTHQQSRVDQALTREGIGELYIRDGTYQTNTGSSAPVPLSVFSLTERKLSSPPADAHGCRVVFPPPRVSQSRGANDAKCGMRPVAVSQLSLPELSVAALLSPVICICGPESVKGVLPCVVDQRRVLPTAEGMPNMTGIQSHVSFPVPLFLVSRSGGEYQ